MKVLKLLYILFITLAILVHAQDEVEIFGYFESQYMGTYINERLEQVQSNKLRIDLQYTFSDNISFAANFDYITYHGKTEWYIMDYLSDNIINSVPEEMRNAYIIPFEDRQFLDNAYIKMTFEKLDLTFGKQQLSFGSGYVWNPTDVFNTKDVLDPTYEQPGHNAMRLDMPVGSGMNLTALYSPEESWDASGKLIQIKTSIPRFDVSGIFVETQWNFHNYTQLDPVTQYFAGTPERRRLYGGNLEGELLGLGLWAEYAYNQMEITEDFQEIVIGSNYTFDFQTFVMVEYYRNTLGKENEQDYDLTDWMRYFTAEQKTLSKDQLYLLVQQPVTDFIDLGLMNIISLSDGSVAVVPTMNWSFSENVDITAYVNMNIGSEGKSFSESQGNGGLIRARIYF